MENILVANDYGIKICDLGLADPLNYEIRYARGSPGYIAPEQFKNTFSGPKSDIFALGVMLYSLVMGKFPWKSTQPEKCEIFEAYKKNKSSLFMAKGDFNQRIGKYLSLKNLLY